MTMERIIIAAVADNGAIGRNNALLWHISGDLKFFKKNTTGCPVIMGRRTFESLGRPLPGRLNIVISRSFRAPEGTLTASSLGEALDMASSLAGSRGMSTRKCFIIGGGQVYADAIEVADKLILTRVHTVVEDADTFFPIVSPDRWEEETRSESFRDPSSGLDYEFVTYKRK